MAEFAKGAGLAVCMVCLVLIGIGLAGMCSCSLGGPTPVTLYINAPASGPATMEAPPPPETVGQAAAPAPAKPFGAARFWSYLLAGVGGVAVIGGAWFLYTRVPAWVKK